MERPYSPAPSSTRHHGGSHSPPLVPIPPHSSDQPEDPASYNPNYRRRNPDPYHTSDPYYPPPPPEHWQYHPQHYPPPSHDYRGDPYYRPPPQGYHHRDPYDYPPRNPYDYPPRDPYSYGPPPRADPYYPPPTRGWSGCHNYSAQPPPIPVPTPTSSTLASSSLPPAPPSLPSVPPQPVPSSTTTTTTPFTFPTSSTAVSLGPHPIHGHLDPSSDLSIPILYLSRPISTKTFNPLKARFKERFELRFVNSLLELERDLKIVHQQDEQVRERALREFEEEQKSKVVREEGEEEGGGSIEEVEKVEFVEPKRTRRRIWITAVGGTDALVQKVWNQTMEKIEWKETVDLNHLQMELLWEEKRVGELIEEEERERRGDTFERGEDEDRVREWDEQEKGRREIEEREQRYGNETRGEGAEVEELDRVLRAVRGENQVESDRAREEYGTGRGGGGEVPEPSRLGTSRNGERGEVVVDRFEDMVKSQQRHDANGNDVPSTSNEVEDAASLRSRKRSRHESEEGHDHSVARAARKKLEAICKAPRRNCIEWSKTNGFPVDEETKIVEQEPVLGERHRGVWNLFGHELDDVSPQIQVLMARAMRDLTYPPRLRLYETPESFEQLEQTVPWFTTVLKMVKDRYELAGAATIVPQDPIVTDEPLETAVEASKNDESVQEAQE
ncbi:hypothetical protein JCM16303_000585 [Sporobolomyces ruberrimus]